MIKTLNIEISVHEYLTVDEKSVFLVLADAVLGSGSAFTYDGNVMYYSEGYGAWCYLVITDEDLDLSKVQSLVRISAQSNRVMESTGLDVDHNGQVDWNDAQLVHDLYNAKYDAFDAVNMSKFLSADVNGDCKLDVKDVAQIAWEIWKSEEERT